MIFSPFDKMVFVLKGPIATFNCDVPTEKVISKGEQMHERI